jgi:GAF domain-containing protein
LSAATGEAGREMLARSHRLKVGEVGMVGYVTGSGQPRITLNVEADPTHYKNPLLPETRSEMTLPLKVGDRIIGALDVQSHYPNAFSEDDIAIMQVMADQLAVAIQNARLIQESQENLRHLEKLYGAYSQKAGVKTIRNQSGASAPIASGRTTDLVHFPIMVRGQEVATLDAWLDEETSNAEQRSLLQAIADRLGQTLENARLYMETQSRAERERMASDITAKMRASNDPSAILQTALTELRSALNIQHKASKLAAGDIMETPPENGNGQSQVNESRENQ